MGGGFCALKSLFFAPQKRRRESSPFLSLVFSEFFFVTARFRGGFGQRTPCFVVALFPLVLGARTGMDLLVRFREFFFAVFSGLLGRGFRFFFSPLPPSSSPFLLLGSAWAALLFFSFRCCQDCRRRRQVLRCTQTCHAMCSLSFLLSLPGRPPSPLPFSFSFFLSFFLSFLFLSLSLFLFLLHASDTESAPTLPCFSGEL